MISQILNADCFDILSSIESNSIDLIITDPPYLISKPSNFHTGKKNKFNVIKIDFGEWDKKEFDMNKLISEYYRILKKSGTLIIFYDIWKCNSIKSIADSVGFKQPRVCQWVKTNPVPVNSKINYLSNAIEYFFTFIKDKNPTFKSSYDKGIYNYPICHGKERTKHPTQKPLSLIKDLIEKHSNIGDMVLDTFAGVFTTHIACNILERKCISIEKDEEYFNIGKDRIEKNSIK